MCDECVVAFCCARGKGSKVSLNHVQPKLFCHLNNKSALRGIKQIIQIKKALQCKDQVRAEPSGLGKY